MMSLRNRLLLGSIGVIALLIIVSNMVVGRMVHRTVYGEFDKKLIHKAQTLAAFTELTEDGLELDMHEGDFPEFQPGPTADYFQIWRPDQTCLIRSASLGREDLPGKISAHQSVYCFSTPLPDQRSGRQCFLQFHPRIDEDEKSLENSGGRMGVTATLAVGSSTEDIDTLLARLQFLLWSITIGALALSVAAMTAVINQGLRPLRHIASQIDHIDAANLENRVRARKIPVELASIVSCVNDLLDRLHHTLAREKSFTANVAHELRTPLSGMRSTIEVCRSRARQEHEYTEALDRTLTICKQSQTMVENLLEMSRIESGRANRNVRSFDIESLLRECWSAASGQARRKQLDVRWHVSSPHMIFSDKDKLRVVIANLLDNAVSYCNEGGVLSIGIRESDDQATLVIENSGCELSCAELEQVFDRFWRADVARSQTGNHFGLGLPLAKRMAELLDGHLQVSVADDIFRATLNLGAAS
ncbi:MAG: GHKL domain-containing protein [Planctomycetales bacterium]|nr:GHKL domain-containing protein [Planctomycetales bacterium]